MTTSVALSPHFERFIQQQIESGRFGNVSEVIRAGLRLLEEHQQRHVAQIHELRAAVSEGMASGEGTAAEEVFDRLESKYRGRPDAQVE